MTVHGVIVLVCIGLVLLYGVLDLVRRDRLYVGYGIIFIGAILGAILVLSWPSLLALVTRAVGAVFPVSALTLLALLFVVLMLIYVLSQVTIVSNRLALVVQEIAVQRAKEASVARELGNQDPVNSERHSARRDSPHSSQCDSR
jgi:hypothetical protein